MGSDVGHGRSKFNESPTKRDGPVGRSPCVRRLPCHHKISHSGLTHSPSVPDYTGCTYDSVKALCATTNAAAEGDEGQGSIGGGGGGGGVGGGGGPAPLWDNAPTLEVHPYLGGIMCNSELMASSRVYVAGSNPNLGPH